MRAKVPIDMSKKTHREEEMSLHIVEPRVHSREKYSIAFGSMSTNTCENGKTESYDAVINPVYN